MSHSDTKLAYLQPSELFYEIVYVTIGNPTFCLLFYLTGVHYRGELQHVGQVGKQKIKFRPIRT